MSSINNQTTTLTIDELIEKLNHLKKVRSLGGDTPTNVIGIKYHNAHNRFVQFGTVEKCGSEKDEDGKCRGSSCGRCHGGEE